MTKMHLLRLSAAFFICLALFISSGFYSPFQEESKLQKYPMKLSDYALFKGDPAEQIPEEGVIPYELNTPLFSDYAEKLRFIKLPEGEKADYRNRGVLAFPEGTIIIKTFYYPVDKRSPEKGRKLMETRLLIHEAEGWKAVPYHWNEDQTEAYLEVAGGMKEVSWKDERGKKQKVNYVFPNMNQCKGCHSNDGEMTPIGPSAKQLNGEFSYDEGVENQLLFWDKHKLLTGMPEMADIPKIAVWNEPSSGSLDHRARAWLDINCAHCHNPKGPASTTGLFLEYEEMDQTALGMMKTPVAAGRGSGGFLHDIEPGKPDQSILYYRINSEDPGVMMPELGRKLIHKEGVALIREWIGSM
ncbi:MAG: SO2930 family diheme c-type cytochrome [Bacteroidota bacterium]